MVRQLPFALAPRPVLIISSDLLAEECLTVHDLAFANRPQLHSMKHTTFNYTFIAIANYGPYWRSVRRIAAVELLSPQSIQMSSNFRAGEVQDMVRRLFRSWNDIPIGLKNSNGLKKVDLKTCLFEQSMNMMMMIIAGKRFYGDNIEDVEEIEQFRKGIELQLSSSSAANIEDYIPVLRKLDLRGILKKRAKLGNQNKEMMKKLIEQQRSSDQKKKTMIADMLELQRQDPEGYNDEMIQAISMSMLLGGTETTSNAIEWAMSHLLNNQDVLKKAVDEIDKLVGKERLVEESDMANLSFLHCIRNEVLRLYPAGPILLPHESRKDITVGGYNIPRGTMLLVNTYYIHRDPDMWEEPTKFKPERFEHRKAEGKWMIPFGMGRRRCPGEGLAMRNLGLVLGTLIQCFEWERPTNELVDLTEGPGLTLPKAIPLEAMYRPRESMFKLLSGL